MKIEIEMQHRFLSMPLIDHGPSGTQPVAKPSRFLPRVWIMILGSGSHKAGQQAKL
jgi:hypothetical protein